MTFFRCGWHSLTQIETNYISFHSCIYRCSSRQKIKNFLVWLSKSLFSERFQLLCLLGGKNSFWRKVKQEEKSNFHANTVCLTVRMEVNTTRYVFNQNHAESLLVFLLSCKSIENLILKFSYQNSHKFWWKSVNFCFGGNFVETFLLVQGSWSQVEPLAKPGTCFMFMRELSELNFHKFSVKIHWLLV